MFETPFLMVGTIVTDPILRRVGEQQVFKFRVASNSRRRTAEGNWEAGNSLFVNVNCWGRLVDGVSGTLIKGDPVVVVGHRLHQRVRRQGGQPALVGRGARHRRRAGPGARAPCASSSASAPRTTVEPRRSEAERRPTTTPPSGDDGDVEGRGPATDGVAASAPRLGWSG